MYDIISCSLHQESFALEGSNPNSTTNILGTIQIHSESLLFTPPANTKIHLTGKEQIGNTCRIIVNDTYQISTCPDDWQSPLGNTTSDYNLPFSLPVSNNIPTSFQIYDQQKDFVCCRIFYTLEIEVSSTEQTITLPVYFHRSKFNKRRNTSISLNDEESEEEEHIPKKLFWGITKQSKQRWQYELEYPHMFDLADCKSGSISLRLRSLSGSKKDIKSDCCLIGCQIIQSIHLEGYQDHIQVLTTATQLLTKPNNSWSKPCQVDFELDEPILPTVTSHTLGVGHHIRVTVEFYNGMDEFDRQSLDMQFPIAFTGCTVAKQIPIKKSVMEEATDRTLVSSPTSISSSNKTINYDNNIDIPISEKALYIEKEHRILCFKYPLSVQS